MKEFFQGLVLGIVVMYGYVYQGADLLGPLKGWVGGWFGEAKHNFEHNRMKKEADKMINGFFFPRDGDREKIARV
jgi:hypothetical protein